MNPKHLEQLEQFVGPGIHTLLQSKEATNEQLNDANPKMRWAAVILMTYHWGPTEQFMRKCEHLALFDADPLGRVQAIRCLGACFAGTANRRIEKLLANIVCNDSESDRMRRSAYMSLFLLSAPPTERMPRPEFLAN